MGDWSWPPERSRTVPPLAFVILYDFPAWTDMFVVVVNVVVIKRCEDERREKGRACRLGRVERRVYILSLGRGRILDHDIIGDDGGGEGALDEVTMRRTMGWLFAWLACLLLLLARLLGFVTGVRTLEVIL